MSTTIEKNELLKIVTPDIEKSTYGEIIELKEKSLSFTPKEQNFNIDDEIEIFTKSEDGNCYVNAKVISINDEEVVVTFLNKWEILSKRDYKRVDIRKNKDIKINREIKNLFIEDMSVSGMKITTSQKFEENTNYEIEMTLDNKNNIKCTFIPLRTDKVENYFQISGKFENLEKLDKIKLTQFCMKTQMENLYK